MELIKRGQYETFKTSETTFSLIVYKPIAAGRINKALGEPYGDYSFKAGEEPLFKDLSLDQLVGLLRAYLGYKA
jgi:hypothetical protein